MNKSDLRKEIRKRRQDFVNQRLNFSVTCPDAVRERLAIARCVAGYVSNGREPDVLPWLVPLAHAAGQSALPWIGDRAEAMQFRLWHPGDDLEKAPFGFLQPRPTANEANPDVILTPLIGFDSTLNRLGQGAGHYDRAFARFPAALRIGVAWSIQQMESLPIDPWDMPLHMIVTENGIFKPTDRA